MGISLSTKNVNIGVIHVAGGQNRLRHNTLSAHTKHSVSRTNCLMHNTRMTALIQQVTCTSSDHMEKVHTRIQIRSRRLDGSCIHSVQSRRAEEHLKGRWQIASRDAVCLSGLRSSRCLSRRRVLTLMSMSHLLAHLRQTRLAAKRPSVP
ncbi:Uncharacterized protein DAT39_017116 [Clarias magur]|uniref:Uncharacterized protein n=1 Tax=Clarias magur TaxID=1594786 RepID=A0A8J4TAW0_CLAMG|nr:Uncharacterized protein DAT39_017116 [Clarias magur]